ncbi:hypothetical protein L227DRAFT_589055 [Lentinus tigrinus ALCF2SS1-6]|uniref:Uncharacterized protein n=1 Tax=Lentinus tigrinus ALCF2SS1-6 TaxID=1328759 RepID=A0A5C2RSB2_9APHY|nr:hypothetical protein L227DRAFT_589055 [Lentinus tigrinus ALCF2SS1-6]
MGTSTLISQQASLSGLAQDVVPQGKKDHDLYQLRCDIRSIEPDPADIQCYEALRAAGSGLFPDEDARREAFTGILTSGGILPAYARRGYIGNTKYNTDGDLRAACLDRELVYYVQEIKREIDTSTADPYVEAIHYWIENIRNFFNAADPEDDDLVAKLNFPAIIVLHFGPYLAIAAAAYGDEPNIEHLCIIPLHVHTTNDDELAAGDRALAALRVALQRLRASCPTLPMNRGPRADFPFRDYYVDSENIYHPFTYVSSIDGQRIFRVSENGIGTPLCVKFCKRYCAEAHAAAHSAGFAPALLAVNIVYDWTMVVIDDRSAEYSSTVWDIKRNAQDEADEAEQDEEKKKAKQRAKENTRKPRPAVSLADAQKEVKSRLQLLHDRGFVHGDVRDVNVLVRNEDAPGNRPNILIVDWDWSGALGAVKYPRGINMELARPLDARAGEPIKPEHDLWMALRLLN